MTFSGLIGQLDPVRRAVMRRPFVPVAAALLVAASLPAEAETFGRTTVGDTASSGLRVGYQRGSKFTLPQHGTATSICAWLDGGAFTDTRDQQTVRFVMYRDANGAPGQKLAETEEIRVWAGQGAFWRCEYIGWTSLTPGDYWLMIHSAGGGAEVGDLGTPARFYYDGPANYFAGPDHYWDGASDPFGAGGAGNGTISIYANYMPFLQLAGRTTVGSVPSAPLRGDFKRGSSITFAEAGRVSGLSAYLDSADTPYGQKVRLALYEDVNGTAGNLVTQSFDNTVLPNTPGRWFTFPTPETEVRAARYWLMVHTANSGQGNGPTRYFADGTAGNWLGNADAFHDGSSSPFGTAGAGNGTLSAFASYLPGISAEKKFGYTKIGDVKRGWTGTMYAPGGLGDANIEASAYRLTRPVTLDGLHAYLDGLGGGSGSQQVRMVLLDTAVQFSCPLPCGKQRGHRPGRAAAGLGKIRYSRYVAAAWVVLGRDSRRADGRGGP
jgi:hypothetical protein